MTERNGPGKATSGAAPTLEADYVVVGAGAVGLGFVDVLLDETQSDILLIDRRDRKSTRLNSSHW